MRKDPTSWELGAHAMELDDRLCRYVPALYYRHRQNRGAKDPSAAVYRVSYARVSWGRGKTHQLGTDIIATVKRFVLKLDRIV